MRPRVIMAMAAIGLVLTGCSSTPIGAAPIAAFNVQPNISKMDLNADGQPDYLWTSSQDSKQRTVIALTSPDSMGLNIACTLTAGLTAREAMDLVPGAEDEKDPGNVFRPTGDKMTINGTPHPILLTGTRGLNDPGRGNFIDFYALPDWSMGIVASCLIPETDNYMSAANAASKWLAYWVSANTSLDNTLDPAKYGQFVLPADTADTSTR